MDNVYNSVYNLKKSEFSNKFIVDKFFDKKLFCLIFCVAFLGFVYIVYSFIVCRFILDEEAQLLYKKAMEKILGMGQNGKQERISGSACR